jgi:hypothetical protein
MSREKIESALSAALRHLEDSMAALSDNDQQAFSDSLWSTSAETEYAVFLLSLILGDKAEGTPRKHNSLPKQLTEFKPALKTALESLNNAKENLETGRIKKSHEEARAARNILLKAQELLERKRKEAKKHAA